MSLSVMLFWVGGPVCIGGGIEDTLFGGGSGIITDPSMLIYFSVCNQRNGSFIGDMWSWCHPGGYSLYGRGSCNPSCSWPFGMWKPPCPPFPLRVSFHENRSGCPHNSSTISYKYDQHFTRRECFVRVVRLRLLALMDLQRLHASLEFETAVLASWLQLCMDTC